MTEFAIRRSERVDRLREIAHDTFHDESTASKAIITKSTKRSSKAWVDRAVACMIAGFNEARRTGKFPKVY